MKKDSRGGKKKGNAKGLEKRKKKVILFTWSPATEEIIGDRIRYWAPPDHLFLCIYIVDISLINVLMKTNVLLSLWGFVFNLNQFSLLVDTSMLIFFLRPSSYLFSYLSFFLPYGINLLRLAHLYYVETVSHIH